MTAVVDLLPVGTIVEVTERGPHARPPYVGTVVGYDLFRSKYEIGARYGGWNQWLYLDGGSWAFPTEVTALGPGVDAASIRRRAPHRSD